MRAIPADRLGMICQALRRAIIEQALEPGTKLPEDAIGERFGASRTIVRQALGQLAAEGLVELRRNKGAAVAIPSWDQARDIFDIRVAIERLVVSRLAGAIDTATDPQARGACGGGGELSLCITLARSSETIVPHKLLTRYSLQRSHSA